MGWKTPSSLATSMENVSEMVSLLQVAQILTATSSAELLVLLFTFTRRSDTSRSIKPSMACKPSLLLVLTHTTKSNALCLILFIKPKIKTQVRTKALSYAVTADFLDTKYLMQDALTTMTSARN